ncbi:hypothetical protein KSP39_PZI015883 [Platanthera zijinensis]|uniref:Uncharacterized protein n=1 Tax=Platanthera zijinensis TaxID=2320716 RepID=A0AAP0G1E8_9ASPA
MKMCRQHVFTNWEYSHSLARATSFGEGDLFKVPVVFPANSAYVNGSHCRRKVRMRNGVRMENHCSLEQIPKKQGKASDFSTGRPRRRRAPKAVDEDLYTIPKELLFQKPKTLSWTTWYEIWSLKSSSSSTGDKRCRFVPWCAALFRPFKPYGRLAPGWQVVQEISQRALTGSGPAPGRPPARLPN